jgi:hypothetical protein
MRAVKGSLGHSLKVRYKESEGPRWTREVGNPPGPPPLARRAGSSGSFGSSGLSGFSGCFGLFGFSGSSNETNKTDQIDQINQSTQPLVPPVSQVSRHGPWTGAAGPGTGGLCRQAGVSRMAGQLPVQTLSGVVQLQQLRDRNAEDRRM